MLFNFCLSILAHFLHSPTLKHIHLSGELLCTEACHSSHPSADDIRVTFSPHCGIVGVFLPLNPYLAEMKKSKQSQLTGGEETRSERVTQWALLLCCWALHALAVEGMAGTVDDWIDDAAEAVIWSGAGLALGLGAAHDDPHVRVWQGGLVR